MNVYDTELIRAILTKENFSFVKTEDEADIVMLNTCAIRENAHQKVYGRIHSIHHKFNPAGGGAGSKSPMIGILGCMATNLRKELFENRKLKVDFIAGPDSYKRLPQLIREAYMVETPRRGILTSMKKPYDVTLSEFETYSDVYPSRSEGANAWIAVMRGCNNFCTFCVVPYTRGRERSRAPDNIVEEVRRLVSEGFKQVTLLGQNVNSYNHEDHDFAYLLEKVSEVEGIHRIRFMSPHPKDFPEALLKVIVNNPKVCKQMHLPLQAGNNRILEMMNRTYTKEEFLLIVDKARSLYPDIALSTDVIVGFPTETDSEFEDTLRVLEKGQFDFAYTFKYSQRQGTVAARQYPDDVPEEVKSKRITILNDMLRNISITKNQKHIGKTFEILIEDNRVTESKNEAKGRTDSNMIVVVENTANLSIGQLVHARIKSATGFMLKGELVK